LWFVLAVSVGFNVLLLFVAVGGMFGGLGESSGNGQVYTRYHSGKRTASDKIAIIHLEGMIMEGMTGFFTKQIEEAATDDSVKAVVLRINSPGGSITASDDLYKKLCELRDGKYPRTDRDGKNQPKKIVVSMASLAASGGYYVAMPSEYILAERTTVTGSIGVYASFPNITKFANEHGFGMDVIKRGDVKNSGSMFHTMTPQERQIWQDMVNNAYDQFLQVVETGRPKLKGKLTDVVIKRPVQDEHGKAIQPEEVYIRKRADGGIFTAQQAKEFGLIDGIGYLEDAVAKAEELAGGGPYKVITYERPRSLFGDLLGSEGKVSLPSFDLSKLSAGATPRLWYLAPQNELAGLLAATGRE